MAAGSSKGPVPETAITVTLPDAMPPITPPDAIIPPPFSSAADMKYHLQSLLDSKEKQLQQAGTLGQRVLAQQMELEERIRQLQDITEDKTDDEHVDDGARERYLALAETLTEWDRENADLSSAFGAPPSSPADTEGDSPTLPATAAAQSRRAKNAAHRADDVEFAFEIGSGLLTEVRRLQSLVGERDKAVQDLEMSVEGLRAAFRQQDASADKYKEENWNLEVTLQDLRTQLAAATSAEAAASKKADRLTAQLAASFQAAETAKNEAERLVGVVDEMKSKHEADVAAHRKAAAALVRDKSDLQGAVDRLKAKLSRGDEAGEESDTTIVERKRLTPLKVGGPGAAGRGGRGLSLLQRLGMASATPVVDADDKKRVETAESACQTDFVEPPVRHVVKDFAARHRIAKNVYMHVKWEILATLVTPLVLLLGLRDSASYKHLLACRDDDAQQLLDLVQDITTLFQRLDLCSSKL
ncbi:hypothetical protein B0H17DRAFT_1207136 [Mycena rosella]|uniref:Uncharacterized protein n=1 Tax=Mycena rosella TaxID=1033263 RepID=A0AAD7G861_MYCRO|nr:hypothetical protein B0H17DRAFT_1207136 [Mycena rosella]